MMFSPSNSIHTYQVGGSLKLDSPSYVYRKADEELYLALRNGQFCDVLCSRQMGKSSLRVRVMQRLKKEGISCASIDMTRVGSQGITPDQWYGAIINDLWRNFNLLGKVRLIDWMSQHQQLTPLHRLKHFIEDILFVYLRSEKIIVCIDEVDSVLSLKFSTDDFFSLIRSYYNRRADNPEYSRLAFAIFGVLTPSDLVQDKKQTPFNIGKSIKLCGFNPEEDRVIEILSKGLLDTKLNSRKLIQEILKWTGGQPFLTQKICQITQSYLHENNENSIDAESALIEKLIYSHLIDSWESKDEPEHLRTIQNRLLYNDMRAGYLLEAYQLILHEGSIPISDVSNYIELLLSGIVVEQKGILVVNNRIYELIFSKNWVQKKLHNLRPYSENFVAWVKSSHQDKSRLLRGQALQDALIWAEGKELSVKDYQFLNASQLLERKQIKQKAIIRLQRFVLGGMSLILVFVVVFAVNNRFLYKKAEKILETQINALSQSSENLSNSSQEFDALLFAMRAGQPILEKQLQANAETRNRVVGALRRSIYGVKELNRLEGHEHWVMSVAFSPNGQMIATASADHTAKIWTAEGKEQQALLGHQDIVEDVVFSPDNRMIATASADKTAILWNLEGEILRTLSGHSQGVRAIRFSPDGQYIATASADKTVKIWDLQGRELKTLVGHSGPVLSLSFNPSGSLIATAGLDKTVRLWSLEGDDVVVFTGHQNGIYDVRFRADGQVIASVSEDKTTKIWNLEGQEIKTLLGHDAWVFSLDFSPDGDTIATASGDKTVKLWSQDGREFSTLIGHHHRVVMVRFSPDGQTLASASWDNTVKLWKIDNQSLTILGENQDLFNGVSFSPDGHKIAAANQDHTAKFWTTDGTKIQTIHGHKAGVNSVSFSPDGQLIATASLDNTAKIWNLDGTEFRTLHGHNDSVNSVSFSPDGQLIATASWDNTAKIWNLDGTEFRTLHGHNSNVSGISFSPDNRSIATASWDNTVKLWKQDEEDYELTLVHDNPMVSASFSPNNEIIATGGWSGNVTLWNSKGRVLEVLKGHEAPITHVVFSPNGQFVAAASEDGTVKLWTTKGQQLSTLTGHQHRVTGLNFSPDGKWLVTASWDGSILLWKIDFERLVNSVAINNMDLFELMAWGCTWTDNYRSYNRTFSVSERKLCD